MLKDGPWMPGAGSHFPMSPEHPRAREPHWGAQGSFVLSPSLLELDWEALLDVPSVCSPEVSPSGA